MWRRGRLLIGAGTLTAGGLALSVTGPAVAVPDTAVPDVESFTVDVRYLATGT